jgi:hypothetical protein
MSDEETLAFDSAVLMLAVNPLGLTNDAIDTLQAASPALASQAIEARRRAQLATLPANSRPLETKAIEKHPMPLDPTRLRPTRPRPRFMTRKEFRQWERATADAIGDAVAEVVKRAVAPRDAKLRELSARIEALEQRLSTERRLAALERATGVLVEDVPR